MRNRFMIMIALCALAFTSCRQKIEVTVHYPDKEVRLNCQRVLVSVGSPILNNTLHKVSSDTFPDYTPAIPDTFNVYFIATTGSDQGQLIKEFDGLSSGVHSITVPGRQYNVVVTNYSAISSTPDYARRWLPENSDSLYLYGSAALDFTNTDEGEVTVTNDYAAALVLQNDMVLEAPKVNGTTFFDTGDYYALFLRDQNGGSFSRNIQMKIKKPDGGSKTYNLNNAYDPNIVYRFALQMYSSQTGDFNIIVDSDILTNVKDSVIVPN